jgi:hypothetical protein
MADEAGTSAGAESVVNKNKRFRKEKRMWLEHLPRARKIDLLLYSLAWDTDDIDQ